MKKWYVFKEIRVWRYCPELDRFLWVEVFHRPITRARNSETDANADFSDLGFEIDKTGCVQCNDNIIPDRIWVRHIVQCRSEY